MRPDKAWIIAEKDFKVYLKKKSILFSVILFPLIVSVGLPFVVKQIIGTGKAIPPDILEGLLNSFLFFFIIGAVAIPTTIASYSIVGEKIEKSLEPLLAAPVSDAEILLGKTISALFPTLVALYIGASIFMVFINNIVYHILGGLYYPNPGMWIVLLVLVPLAGILSVELSIIISSRVDDVRSAQQYSGLLVIPFAALYALGETRSFTFSVTNLLIISGILLVLDIVFFFLSTKTFNREGILTKWK